jgi:hypothetical protein
MADDPVMPHRNPGGPGSGKESKMARHFGAQHMHNGYAAMGGALGRPIYKGASTGKTIAESIAAERRKAAREAAARKNKK